MKIGLQEAKYEQIHNSLEDRFNKEKLPNALKRKAFEYLNFCWRNKVIFELEWADFTDLSEKL